MKTIIHVSGDPLEGHTLSSLLAGRFSVLLCEDEVRAREIAHREPGAAIIVDLDSESNARLPLVSLFSGEGRRVIAVSRAVDPKTVVRVVRRGAHDFLRKPFSAEELESSLSGNGHDHDQPSDPFTGTSAAIRAAAAQLRLFARSSFPVLIIGESGTGKEIAARAVHRLSGRSGGPFVPRNCAALPDLLIESELFGTERGAFTDAVSRPGAFELAKGGTLFLDEIGEAGLPMQAKLLRALETGEIWRLGSAHPVTADVRLVSASSRDLRRTRSFRPDLLYRIETLVLELPPLRERREDIPDLASCFSLAASGGRALPGPSALRKLVGHDWPGNVRQLRNVVHRAIVLAAGADELRAEHIVF
jgi:DNA-binding NtrC family response regulator